MTKRIIVPFDGSSASWRAHAAATALAARLGDHEIELLAVAAGGQEEREIRECVQTRCLHDPLCVVRSADPAAAIAGATATPDAIVCMATHGRGRSALLLGSVATDVVRRARRPVLLVGPACERDWLHDPARVLTCWAGTGSAPILPHAEEWAATLGGEIWLEYVFHPLDVVSAENPTAQLAPATELIGSADVHLRALESDYPAGALVRSARELPATLVAMTTHARTGPARSALGSVAMDVVRHAPCPVLLAHTGG